MEEEERGGEECCIFLKDVVWIGRGGPFCVFWSGLVKWAKGCGTCFGVRLVNFDLLRLFVVVPYVAC